MESTHRKRPRRRVMQMGRRSLADGRRQRHWDVEALTAVRGPVSVEFSQRRFAGCPRFAGRIPPGFDLRIGHEPGHLFVLECGGKI
jgi:hypothetical protein